MKHSYNDYMVMFRDQFNAECMARGFKSKCSPEDDSKGLIMIGEELFGLTTYNDFLTHQIAIDIFDVMADIYSSMTVLKCLRSSSYERKYIKIVNFQWFAGRLDWGTSIRSAWFNHDGQKVDLSLFIKNSEQLAKDEQFTADQFKELIVAAADFAGQKHIVRRING